MLKQLQKIFNTAAVADKEEVDMSVASQVEASADVAAELSKATEALAASASAMEQVMADFEQLKAELEILKSEKQLAVKVEKEKKLSVRMSTIKAAIGDEKAPALLAATEDLEDSQFEAVVSAMSMSVDKESKSQLFSEVGVDVESDASSVVEKSAIMVALEKQYHGA